MRAYGVPSVRGAVPQPAGVAGALQACAYGKTMTSHDVRRMKLCSVCSSIGVYKPKDPVIDVALVVAVPDGPYAHPRCCGLETLMALSDCEIEYIRLCDVSQRTMAALMRRRRVGV